MCSYTQIFINVISFSATGYAFVQLLKEKKMFRENTLGIVKTLRFQFFNIQDLNLKIECHQQEFRIQIKNKLYNLAIPNYIKTKC